MDSTDWTLAILGVAIVALTVAQMISALWLSKLNYKIDLTVELYTDLRNDLNAHEDQCNTSKSA